MSYAIHVGIVMARRRLTGPWGGEAWSPHAILAAVPSAPAGTWIGPDLYYAGNHAIPLDPRAVPFYRDNLESGRPSVWVAALVDGSTCKVQAVTFDPDEGEALSADPGLVVEPLAMPQGLVDLLAEYVAARPVVRRFEKRQRRRQGEDVR